VNLVLSGVSHKIYGSPAVTEALGERVALVDCPHSCANETRRATTTPSSTTNYKGVTGHNMPIKWARRRPELFFSWWYHVAWSEHLTTDGCSRI
jgi:hypothetical protein